MSLLAVAILGILASLATEIITWLNAKLSGSVLKGKGAFILSIVLALVFGAIKIIYTGDFSWESMGTTFASIWTASQIYFILIAQWLGLEVKQA